MHVEKTIEAFSKLSGKSIDKVLEAYKNANYFKEFERGNLSDEEFRAHLKKDLAFEASDSEIDEAWNAMLGDIPAERLAQISSLIKEYTCKILSNTNAIHERAFHQILSENHGLNHLNELFDKVYFSHELSARKPDRIIYEKVLEQSKVSPQEIMFLDDSLENLQGAEKVDYQTLYIKRNEGFMKALEEKFANL